MSVAQRRARASRDQDARSIETPAALGYRMPAEWEPHAATWLAWPHERSDWPGKFGPIPWVYGEVVRHLAPGERVRILVEDAAAEQKAKRLLARVGAALAQLEFFRFPTDRVWTRDYCPLFVSDGKGCVDITNWIFNGWAKYPNHKLDNQVPDKLARRLKRRQWQPSVDGRRVVLEGGSIDVNGRGALLTTEECLLSEVQARNPGLSRAELERVLADHLGARKVLWLGEGIVGDDTHGHVDDLARFVDERTIVLAQEEDPRDDNFARLRDNAHRLAKLTDQDGRALTVVPLPMPAPLFLDGQRLPASYANFYIGNAAVLVPTFNDANDRRALETLARVFPSRRVIGVHAVDLVWGLGTLHCMTQQEPACAS
jgi:agmatine deiminase